MEIQEAPIALDEYAALDPLERVAWVDRRYGRRAILLSSMQKTAGVLMHLIHRARARIAILFVDTEFHFAETLQTRDRFVERYGLRIVTVHPALSPDEQRREYGCELHQFADGQPVCCELRKERPFLDAARAMRAGALVSGLMRSEGGSRAKIQPIGYDPRLLCPVYHPIFDWDEARVDAYAAEWGVPVHPLHARSYPSIGCAPCTTPVREGEDKRAGRWRHLKGSNGSRPHYCGVNYIDRGAGI
jgi:phosphoadenosine phosphosulfate reductase